MNNRDLPQKNKHLFENGKKVITIGSGFEAATLIQYNKIGPFPLVLIGGKFWKGLRDFVVFMAEEGVFSPEEIGFARIVETPEEAIEMVLSSLPSEFIKTLKTL